MLNISQRTFNITIIIFLDLIFHNIISMIDYDVLLC